MTAQPRVVLDGHRLILDLGAALHCLSGAVLGGGMAALRTWLNVQVPRDYARLDPAAHLAQEAAGLAGPVLGMLTAADVASYQDVRAGCARAIATVGLGIPLAAASPEPGPDPGPDPGRRPGGGPAPGTINILALVDAKLTGAGLAGAFQTAVEAKAQALAAAGIRAGNAPGFATGTATDVLAVACPPGATVAFAGPATVVGADLASAVYRAILQGCEAWFNAGAAR